MKGGKYSKNLRVVNQPCAQYPPFFNDQILQRRTQPLPVQFPIEGEHVRDHHRHLCIQRKQRNDVNNRLVWRTCSATRGEHGVHLRVQWWQVVLYRGGLVAIDSIPDSLTREEGAVGQTVHHFKFGRSTHLDCTSTKVVRHTSEIQITILYT